MTPGCSRPPRPLRPLPWAKRVEAFVAEVLDDALADGLVERCAGRDGGQGYRATPEGEEWLRTIPPWMLDCGPRAFQERPVCGGP